MMKFPHVIKNSDDGKENQSIRLLYRLSTIDDVVAVDDDLY